MSYYAALNQQIFTTQDYTLTPIRFEDRFLIMKWRNEQIYHLRQAKLLTPEEQDNYFNNVIAKEFYQENPTQLLFSLLKNDICIGYGGLVHINYIDKNAEVSFLMDTNVETDFFEINWLNYLVLIQQLAFEEMHFYKIFTFAFDLRPKLYKALLAAGFYEEARLKSHCFFENKFIDVLIHAKLNVNAEN